MKSAIARDATVAKVNETFAKWPSFEDVPEVKTGGDMAILARGNQADYVKGLYAICAHGEVIGRNSDGQLIGKNVPDAEGEIEATPKGRRLKTGA